MNGSRKEEGKGKKDELAGALKKNTPKKIYSRHGRLLPGIVNPLSRSGFFKKLFQSGPTMEMPVDIRGGSGGQQSDENFREANGGKEKIASVLEAYHAGQFFKVLEICKDIPTGDPAYPKAAEIMGRIALQTNSFEEAIEHFDSALFSDGISLELRTDALLGRSVAEYQTGNYDAAIGSCDQVLSYSPGNGTALLYKSESLLQKALTADDTTECASSALACISGIAAEAGGDIFSQRAVYAKARAFYFLGRFDESLRICNGISKDSDLFSQYGVLRELNVASKMLKTFQGDASDDAKTIINYASDHAKKLSSSGLFCQFNQAFFFPDRIELQSKDVSDLYSDITASNIQTIWLQDDQFNPYFTEKILPYSIIQLLKESRIKEASSYIDNVLSSLESESLAGRKEQYMSALLETCALASEETTLCEEAMQEIESLKYVLFTLIKRECEKGAALSKDSTVTPCIKPLLEMVGSAVSSGKIDSAREALSTVLAAESGDYPANAYPMAAKTIVSLYRSGLAKEAKELSDRVYAGYRDSGGDYYFRDSSALGTILKDFAGLAGETKGRDKEAYLNEFKRYSELFDSFHFLSNMPPLSNQERLGYPSIKSIWANTRQELESFYSNELPGEYDGKEDPCLKEISAIYRENLDSFGKILDEIPEMLERRTAYPGQTDRASESIVLSHRDLLGFFRRHFEGKFYEEYAPVYERFEEMGLDIEALSSPVEASFFQQGDTYNAINGKAEYVKQILDLLKELKNINLFTPLREIEAEVDYFRSLLRKKKEEASGYYLKGEKPPDETLELIKALEEDIPEKHNLALMHMQNKFFQEHGDTVKKLEKGEYSYQETVRMVDDLLNHYVIDESRDKKIGIRKKLTDLKKSLPKELKVTGNIVSKNWERSIYTDLLSKIIACCFLGGGHDKAGPRFLDNPAFLMRDYYYNGILEARAICGIFKDTDGKPVLLVDAVEGSEKINPQLIKDDIEEYAAKAGFTKVVYNAKAENNAPKAFLEKLFKKEGSVSMLLELAHINGQEDFDAFDDWSVPMGLVSGYVTDLEGRRQDPARAPKYDPALLQEIKRGASLYKTGSKETRKFIAKSIANDATRLASMFPQGMQARSDTLFDEKKKNAASDESIAAQTVDARSEAIGWIEELTETAHSLYEAGLPGEAAEITSILSEAYDTDIARRCKPAYLLNATKLYCAAYEKAIVSNTGVNEGYAKEAIKLREALDHYIFPEDVRTKHMAPGVWDSVREQLTHLAGRLEDAGMNPGYVLSLADEARPYDINADKSRENEYVPLNVLKTSRGERIIPLDGTAKDITAWAKEKGLEVREDTDGSVGIRLKHLRKYEREHPETWDKIQSFNARRLQRSLPITKIPLEKKARNDARTGLVSNKGRLKEVLEDLSQAIEPSVDTKQVDAIAALLKAIDRKTDLVKGTEPAPGEASLDLEELYKRSGPQTVPKDVTTKEQKIEYFRRKVIQPLIDAGVIACVGDRYHLTPGKEKEMIDKALEKKKGGTIADEGYRGVTIRIDSSNTRLASLTGAKEKLDAALAAHDAFEEYIMPLRLPVAIDIENYKRISDKEIRDEYEKQLVKPMSDALDDICSLYGQGLEDEASQLLKRIQSLVPGSIIHLGRMPMSLVQRDAAKILFARGRPEEAKAFLEDSRKRMRGLSPNHVMENAYPVLFETLVQMDDAGNIMWLAEHVKEVSKDMIKRPGVRGIPGESYLSLKKIDGLLRHYSDSHPSEAGKYESILKEYAALVERFRVISGFSDVAFANNIGGLVLEAEDAGMAMREAIRLAGGEVGEQQDLERNLEKTTQKTRIAGLLFNKLADTYGADYPEVYYDLNKALYSRINDQSESVEEYEKRVTLFSEKLKYSVESARSAESLGAPREIALSGSFASIHDIDESLEAFQHRCSQFVKKIEIASAHLKDSPPAGSDEELLFEYLYEMSLDSKTPEEFEQALQFIKHYLLSGPACLEKVKGMGLLKDVVKGIIKKVYRKTSTLEEFKTGVEAYMHSLQGVYDELTKSDRSAEHLTRALGYALRETDMREFYALHVLKGFNEGYRELYNKLEKSGVHVKEMNSYEARYQSNGGLLIPAEFSEYCKKIPSILSQVYNNPKEFSGSFSEDVSEHLGSLKERGKNLEKTIKEFRKKGLTPPESVEQGLKETKKEIKKALQAAKDKEIDDFRKTFQQTIKRIEEGTAGREEAIYLLEQLRDHYLRPESPLKQIINSVASFMPEGPSISGEVVVRTWKRAFPEDLSYHNEFFCCAFLGGINDKASVRYLNNPAINMVDFYVGGRRKVRAITAMCEDGTLLVDSVEGTDSLNPVSVKKALDDYAKKCGFRRIIYNEKVFNNTPRKFIKKNFTDAGLTASQVELKLAYIDGGEYLESFGTRTDMNGEWKRPSGTVRGYVVEISDTSKRENSIRDEMAGERRRKDSSPGPSHAGSGRIGASKTDENGKTRGTIAAAGYNGVTIRIDSPDTRRDPASQLSFKNKAEKKKLQGILGGTLFKVVESNPERFSNAEMDAIIAASERVNVHMVGKSGYNRDFLNCLISSRKDFPANYEALLKKIIETFPEHYTGIIETLFLSAYLSKDAKSEKLDLSEAASLVLAAIEDAGVTGGYAIRAAMWSLAYEKVYSSKDGRRRAVEQCVYADSSTNGRLQHLSGQAFARDALSLKRMYGLPQGITVSRLAREIARCKKGGQKPNKPDGIKTPIRRFDLESNDPAHLQRVAEDIVMDVMSGRDVPVRYALMLLQKAYALSDDEKIKEQISDDYSACQLFSYGTITGASHIVNQNGISSSNKTLLADYSRTFNAVSAMLAREGHPLEWVADYGCGSGYMARMFAGKAKVLGIDYLASVCLAVKGEEWLTINWEGQVMEKSRGISSQTETELLKAGLEKIRDTPGMKIETEGRSLKQKYYVSGKADVYFPQNVHPPAIEKISSGRMEIKNGNFFKLDPSEISPGKDLYFAYSISAFSANSDGGRNYTKEQMQEAASKMGSCLAVGGVLWLAYMYDSRGEHQVIELFYRRNGDNLELMERIGNVEVKKPYAAEIKEEGWPGTLYLTGKGEAGKQNRTIADEGYNGVTIRLPDERALMAESLLESNDPGKNAEGEAILTSLISSIGEAESFYAVSYLCSSLVYMADDYAPPRSDYYANLACTLSDSLITQAEALSSSGEAGLKDRIQLVSKLSDLSCELADKQSYEAARSIVEIMETLSFGLEGRQRKPYDTTVKYLEKVSKPTVSFGTATSVKLFLEYENTREQVLESTTRALEASLGEKAGKATVLCFLEIVAGCDSMEMLKQRTGLGERAINDAVKPLLSLKLVSSRGRIEGETYPGGGYRATGGGTAYVESVLSPGENNSAESQATVQGSEMSIEHVRAYEKVFREVSGLPKLGGPMGRVLVYKLATGDAERFDLGHAVALLGKKGINRLSVSHILLSLVKGGYLTVEGKTYRTYGKTEKFKEIAGEFKDAIGVKSNQGIEGSDVAAQIQEVPADKAVRPDSPHNPPRGMGGEAVDFSSLTKLVAMPAEKILAEDNLVEILLKASNGFDTARAKLLELTGSEKGRQKVFQVYDELHEGISGELHSAIGITLSKSTLKELEIILIRNIPYDELSVILHHINEVSKSPREIVELAVLIKDMVLTLEDKYPEGMEAHDSLIQGVLPLRKVSEYAKVKSTLSLGRLLAASGIDPTTVLSDGVISILDLDLERFDLSMEFASRLAGDAIDPRCALKQCVSLDKQSKTFENFKSNLSNIESAGIRILESFSDQDYGKKVVSAVFGHPDVEGVYRRHVKGTFDLEFQQVYHMFDEMGLDSVKIRSYKGGFYESHDGSIRKTGMQADPSDAVLHMIDSVLNENAMSFREEYLPEEQKRIYALNSEYKDLKEKIAADKEYNRKPPGEILAREKEVSREINSLNARARKRAANSYKAKSQATLEDLRTGVYDKGKSIDLLEGLLERLSTDQKHFKVKRRLEALLKELQVPEPIITQVFDRSIYSDCSRKKEFYCSAFVGGIYPEFSVRYLDNPAVVMLDFYPDGVRSVRAIMGICKDNVLVVDSVEGTEGVDPVLIKTAIEDYAVECGFKKVVYHPNPHNQTPENFIKKNFISQNTPTQEMDLELAYIDGPQYFEIFGGFKTPQGRVTGYVVDLEKNSEALDLKELAGKAIRGELHALGEKTAKQLLSNVVSGGWESPEAMQSIWTIVDTLNEAYQNRRMEDLDKSLLALQNSLKEVDPSRLVAVKKLLKTFGISKSLTPMHDLNRLQRIDPRAIGELKKQFEEDMRLKKGVDIYAVSAVKRASLLARWLTASEFGRDGRERNFAWTIKDKYCLKEMLDNGSHTGNCYALGTLFVSLARAIDLECNCWITGDHMVMGVDTSTVNGIKTRFFDLIPPPNKARITTEEKLKENYGYDLVKTPDRLITLENLSRSYSEKKEVLKALEYMDRTLEAHKKGITENTPGHDSFLYNIYNDYMYHCRALSDSAKDAEESKNCLERVIKYAEWIEEHRRSFKKTDSDYASDHYTKACALGKLGRNPEAIKEYDIAESHVLASLGGFIEYATQDETEMLKKITDAKDKAKAELSSGIMDNNIIGMGGTSPLRLDQLRGLRSDIQRVNSGGAGFDMQRRSYKKAVAQAESLIKAAGRDIRRPEDKESVELAVSLIKSLVSQKGVGTKNASFLKEVYALLNRFGGMENVRKRLEEAGIKGIDADVVAVERGTRKDHIKGLLGGKEGKAKNKSSWRKRPYWRAMEWDALEHMGRKGHVEEFKKALGLESLDVGELIRGIERNMSSANMWALPVYEVQGDRGAKRVYVTSLKNAAGETVYVNSTTWIDDMTGVERLVTAYPYTDKNVLERDRERCIDYYLSLSGVAPEARKVLSGSIYPMLDVSGVAARYWPYAIDAMVSGYDARSLSMDSLKQRLTVWQEGYDARLKLLTSSHMDYVAKGTPEERLVADFHAKRVGELLRIASDGGVLSDEAWNFLSFAYEVMVSTGREAEAKGIVNEACAGDQELLDAAESLMDLTDMYAQGRNAFNSGDVAGALQIYEEALAAYPDHALAWRGRAEALEELAKRSQAQGREKEATDYKHEAGNCNKQFESRTSTWWIGTEHEKVRETKILFNDGFFGPGKTEIKDAIRLLSPSQRNIRYIKDNCPVLFEKLTSNIDALPRSKFLSLDVSRAVVYLLNAGIPYTLDAELDPTGQKVACNITADDLLPFFRDQMPREKYDEEWNASLEKINQGIAMANPYLGGRRSDRDILEELVERRKTPEDLMREWDTIFGSKSEVAAESAINQALISAEKSIRLAELEDPEILRAEYVKEIKQLVDDELGRIAESYESGDTLEAGALVDALIESLDTGAEFRGKVGYLALSDVVQRLCALQWYDKACRIFDQDNMEYCWIAAVESLDLLYPPVFKSLAKAGLGDEYVELLDSAVHSAESFLELPILEQFPLEINILSRLISTLNEEKSFFSGEIRERIEKGIQDISPVLEKMHIIDRELGGIDVKTLRCYSDIATGDYGLIDDLRMMYEFWPETAEFEGEIKRLAKKVRILSILSEKLSRELRDTWDYQDLQNGVHESLISPEEFEEKCKAFEDTVQNISQVLIDYSFTLGDAHLSDLLSRPRLARRILALASGSLVFSRDVKSEKLNIDLLDQDADGTGNLWGRERGDNIDPVLDPVTLMLDGRGNNRRRYDGWEYVSSMLNTKDDNEAGRKILDIRSKLKNYPDLLDRFEGVSKTLMLWREEGGSLYGRISSGETLTSGAYAVCEDLKPEAVKNRQAYEKENYNELYQKLEEGFKSLTWGGLIIQTGINGIYDSFARVEANNRYLEHHGKTLSQGDIDSIKNKSRAILEEQISFLEKIYGMPRGAYLRTPPLHVGADLERADGFNDRSFALRDRVYNVIKQGDSRLYVNVKEYHLRLGNQRIDLKVRLHSYGNRPEPSNLGSEGLAVEIIRDGYSKFLTREETDQFIKKIKEYTLVTLLLQEDPILQANKTQPGLMQKTLTINLSPEELKALGPLGQPASMHEKTLRSLADSLGCNLELSDEGMKPGELAGFFYKGDRLTIRIRPDAPMIAAFSCFQHEADHPLRDLLGTLLGKDLDVATQERIARFVDSLGALSLIKLAGNIERTDKALADALYSYAGSEIAEFNRFFGTCFVYRSQDAASDYNIENILNAVGVVPTMHRPLLVEAAYNYSESLIHNYEAVVELVSGAKPGGEGIDSRDRAQAFYDAMRMSISEDLGKRMEWRSDVVRKLAMREFRDNWEIYGGKPVDDAKRMELARLFEDDFAAALSGISQVYESAIDEHDSSVHLAIILDCANASNICRRIDNSQRARALPALNGLIEKVESDGSWFWMEELLKDLYRLKRILEVERDVRWNELSNAKKIIISQATAPERYVGNVNGYILKELSKSGGGVVLDVGVGGMVDYQDYAGVTSRSLAKRLLKRKSLKDKTKVIAVDLGMSFVRQGLKEDKEGKKRKFPFRQKNLDYLQADFADNRDKGIDWSVKPGCADVIRLAQFVGYLDPRQKEYVVMQSLRALKNGGVLINCGENDRVYKKIEYEGSTYLISTGSLNKNGKLIRDPENRGLFKLLGFSGTMCLRVTDQGFFPVNVSSDLLKQAESVKRAETDIGREKISFDLNSEKSVSSFLSSTGNDLSRLADSVLGKAGLPYRRINLSKDDGSCFDDPEAGASNICVNEVSLEQAHAALEEMRRLCYPMEGVSDKLMKSMLELSIYAHENVHSRIRALADSLNVPGDRKYQVLTGVDYICEGLALFGAAETLKAYADEKMGSASGEEKTFLENVVCVAERFDDLRFALSLEHSPQYQHEKEEVQKLLDKGMSLADIVEQKLDDLDNPPVRTGITAKDLVPAKDLKEFDEAGYALMEALEKWEEGSCEFPEGEVTKLLSTMAYGKTVPADGEYTPSLIVDGGEKEYDLSRAADDLLIEWCERFSCEMELQDVMFNKVPRARSGLEE